MTETPAKTATAPEVMTRLQVMEYLQIGRNTFYDIQKSDHPIPDHSIPGGRRFLRKDVDAWLASHPPHGLETVPWAKTA